MFLSLCNSDGILATAVVDDSVWNSYSGSIKQAAYAVGYSTQVDTSAEGLHPSRACRSMADVSAFIVDTSRAS
jgi:hypothetical protein